MRNVQTAQGSGEALGRLPGHAMHLGCTSERQVLQLELSRHWEGDLWRWTVKVAWTCHTLGLPTHTLCSRQLQGHQSTSSGIPWAVTDRDMICMQGPHLTAEVKAWMRLIHSRRSSWPYGIMLSVDSFRMCARLPA